jgi:hypothetical protein
VSFEGKDDENLQQALRYYRLAIEKYKAAFAVRAGHYPGINVASLSLAVYAINASDSHDPESLQTSEQIARDLLRRRAEWPYEFSDDNVWHSATEGECYLLIQAWGKAEAQYKSAMRERNCTSSHVKSMLKQARRNINCFERIGIEIENKSFSNLDKFFQIQSPLEAPSTNPQSTATEEIKASGIG